MATDAPSIRDDLLLTIVNRAGELRRVADWLERAAGQFGWPQRTVFKLDLVLNEFLPNIMSYAYADEEIHHIRIRLEDNPDQVILEICDDGIAFDPFAQIRRPDATSLASASIGGRGIPLIVAFSDAREYARVGQTNRMRVTLTKQAASDCPGP
jgi:anti-sigma regulatory factor (Ser/Thr protein kinase)